MIEANGWHHHERVHIQARSGDLVLVQYTKRQPLAWNGSRKLAPPIQPWAWVSQEDVMHDSELDDVLMKVWKVA